MDIQSLNPSDVRSAYLGKKGCCCGCLGKHIYAAAHREEASTKRGYVVKDSEVNDRQVTAILRTIQANEEKAEIYKDEHISLEIGTKMYIVYLRPSAYREHSFVVSPRSRGPNMARYKVNVLHDPPQEGESFEDTHRREALAALAPRMARKLLDFENRPEGCKECGAETLFGKQHAANCDLGALGDLLRSL